MTFTLTINRNFNPRPPRGGRRALAWSACADLDFNPRPPRGGRRRWFSFLCMGPLHFNPRPPRGGRPRGAFPDMTPEPISIHALLAEGDADAEDQSAERKEFQSTPSSRRATGKTNALQLSDALFQSTPSSRRATHRRASANSGTAYFNPRPPRGGRRLCAQCVSCPEYFNPRPPRGGRR